MTCVRIALFQPDIPQNTGTILRMASCLDVAVDLIGPLGFSLTDARMRRAGLDYWERAAFVRHDSFAAFEAQRRAEARRLVLLSTQAAVPYLTFQFRRGDTLLFGRESAGVTAEVREAADVALRIPILAGRRSLNIATAAAMVLGEALRQIGGFPVE